MRKPRSAFDISSLLENAANNAPALSCAKARTGVPPNGLPPTLAEPNGPRIGNRACHPAAERTRTRGGHKTMRLRRGRFHAAAAADFNGERLRLRSRFSLIVVCATARL